MLVMVVSLSQTCYLSVKVHSQHHSLNASMLSLISSTSSNHYPSMTFSVLPAIIMIHLRSHLPLRPSYTSPIQHSMLFSTLSRSSPALSVQSLLITQRNDSKLQYSLYNRCYQHSLTTFQHSLQQLNDPTINPSRYELHLRWSSTY